MAISQTDYVDITTSTVNETGERSLQGLAFTKASMVGTGNVQTLYAAGTIVQLSLSEVSKYFGGTSPEYEFATRYFGYVSRSGGMPTALLFAKVGPTGHTSETPKDAFLRVDKDTNNFGSFCFIGNIAESGGDYTNTEIAAVASANADLNYKYLFSVGVLPSNATALKTAIGSTVGTVITLGYDDGDESESDIEYENNGYAAYMPMAMFSATDYDASGSTTVFMFKQFSGEQASVTDSATAATYKAANINFYGLTQGNGKTIAFYQYGKNADGGDTACYCNEVWLKAKAASAFMDLLLNVEKIPANSTGVAMITNELSGVINAALKNGTIMPSNTLTTAQENQIIYLSGNSDNAVDNVASSGYTLAVAIVKNSSGDYVGKYRLIYRKGDAIRKIEGIHNLI